jgi:prepilin-type N-terminal cleavage/methylation domain-containing protein
LTLKAHGETARRASSAGLTLVEVLVAIAIFSVIVTGLFQVTSGALATWNHHADREDAVSGGQWALEEMARHVQGSNWVLIPVKENITRNHLAVAEMTLDTNQDGFPDSDNDKDGKINEDYDAGGDITEDGAPGIIGIDDNGDGLVDNGSSINDDDEDGTTNEDSRDGLDNDGDGAIDEDPTSIGADVDGDGKQGEDPVDPVVFYLDTVTQRLMERLPNYATAAFNDYVSQPIATHVTAFDVTRVTRKSGVLIHIRLTLQSKSGDAIILESSVLSRTYP